jgi:hypothetical protein
MKPKLVLSVVAITGGLLFAGCSSSGNSNTSTPVELPASSDCQAFLTANPDATVAATKAYYLVGDAGPEETMYTSDQIASMHPTTGEVMVGGSMSGGDGMSMPSDGTSMPMEAGATMRHIEVHICSKDTGRAVGGAMPTMDIQDVTAGTKTVSMSAAEMQGLDRNPMDTHYGNNASLMSGHAYQAHVVLDGQTAMFGFTAP